MNPATNKRSDLIDLFLEKGATIVSTLQYAILEAPTSDLVEELFENEKFKVQFIAALDRNDTDVMALLQGKMGRLENRESCFFLIEEIAKERLAQAIKIEDSPSILLKDQMQLFLNTEYINLFIEPTEPSKEKIEAYLDQGADIDARSSHGETALMYAAKKGYVTAVSVLLAKGADMTIKNNNKTALDLAQEKGQAPVAEVLCNCLDAASIRRG